MSSSKSPERKPKTMSQEKPLNSDATPFQMPPPPAARNSGNSPSTPIRNHQLVPQRVVVPQAATTLAHNYNHQVVSFQHPVMQPNVLLVFPNYYHYGIPYAQPGAAFHPVSIPVHHTSIIPQPHYPIDQNLQSPDLDPSDNDDSLDNSHHMYSDHEWEDEETHGTDEAERGAGQTGLQWRAKRVQKNYRVGNVPFPTTLEETESSATSTMMIRNLSNDLQLKDILVVLDDHCCRQNRTAADRAGWSMFDFVYLPMDFRKHSKRGKMSNLGYAFVNFTTPRAAFKFYQQYHGNGWCGEENKKCNITAAHIQGKEALVDNFSSKVFRCKSPNFLPIVFSDPRHGFNRESEGTPLGRFVEGQPRKTLASWVSPKTQEQRPSTSSNPSSSSLETEEEVELTERIPLISVSRVQPSNPSPSQEGN